MFDDVVASYRTYRGCHTDDRVVFRGTNNCETRKVLWEMGRCCSDVDIETAKRHFMSNETLMSTYRYFLNVRGLGPFSGTLNKFSLCGIPFVVEDECQQLLMLFMKPYEHYIPIKTDLSDFHEQIEHKHNKQLMDKVDVNIASLTDWLLSSSTLEYYMYVAISTLYKEHHSAQISSCIEKAHG
jgi:hypothetical protein